MIKKLIMKKEELIEILNEEFPPTSAMIEDFIGEQVEIKKNINKILVTLDLTIDVISQAIEKNVDLIISHHPLFFGDKDDLLKNDSFLKSKYDLLKKKNIGVFVIHTNADFNTNSIAYMQGLALDLNQLDQNNENKSVTGTLTKSTNALEFINFVKDTFELKDVEFRTNFDLEQKIKKVTIASGAAGDAIDFNDFKTVNVIGEVKHHEWVKANELNINIMEISHYSEKIFKNIIKLFLEKNDLKNLDIFISKEKNGYKII